MALYDVFGNPLTIPSGEGANANHLFGKTWFPIGDSITNNGSYRYPLIEHYGLTAKNGGFGDGYQCGYGAGSTYSIVEKFANFPSEKPDIITIALGTNDYGNGCPIGTINDDPNSMTSESYTFYGCYKKLLTELNRRYGRVPTVLITPFPRVGMNTANKSNHTLKDYAEAITELGAYYSLTVCDMLGGCGISIGTLCEIEADTREYTTDGLHLNGVAGGVVSGKIGHIMEYALSEFIIECKELTAYKGQNYIGSPVTIEVGASAMVYAVRNPVGTTYPITWESNNETIATVSYNATNYAACSIKGVSSGICTVTARCGSAKLEYSVTVN
jgi:lysophospholipase L1-like esterase